MTCATTALVSRALQRARQTRLLRIGCGERHQVAAAVDELWEACPVTIVADVNTFEAAGRDVFDGLVRSGRSCTEPFVFEQPDLQADFRHVEVLESFLTGHRDAIAVAVGSGTINDLTKLAAHRLQRPYLVVATAASMDGYSSFGASIIRDGFKKTIDCAAPLGIVADLDVLVGAPQGMSAAGYADLLAKSVAGADWLVADTCGVERVDPTAWDMVHDPFRSWIADPQGVRAGDREAIRRLMLGLTMCGLAMQWTRTSRPASGAEHQLSHLWDMQQRHLASHGFQVGIGTLCSSALYEMLLEKEFEDLDVREISSRWLNQEALADEIRRCFHNAQIARRALQETRAKHVDTAQLALQLTAFRDGWPVLRDRLRQHLLPHEQVRQFLRDAGCPTSPQEIGLPSAQLLKDFYASCFIRSRFTILDLTLRLGLLTTRLDRMLEYNRWWPEVRSRPIHHNSS